MLNYIPIAKIAETCLFPLSRIEGWIKEGTLPARTNEVGEYEVECGQIIRFLQIKRYMVPEEYIRKETYRILIVDDEVVIRKILRENLLDTFAGILIEESSDVLDAGWRAHTIVPDLILLDLNLPGMDGFQLCRLIRQRDEFLKTKIIVVSGQHDVATRDKIIECGANIFVAKPFSVHEILDPIFQLFPEFKNFAMAA